MENFNDISKQESVEGEIDQEILKLEENVEGLQQDIEALGGEEGLQEELDKRQLIANRFSDKMKRTINLLHGTLLSLSTSFLVFADTQVLPKINWDLADDNTLGKALTAGTILGVIGSIVAIKEYIKYQKRVSMTKKILA